MEFNLLYKALVVVDDVVCREAEYGVYCDGSKIVGALVKFRLVSRQSISQHVGSRKSTTPGSVVVHRMAFLGNGV